MTIKQKMKSVCSFLADENGAMTIEYLVLTAGAAALAIASTGAVRSSTSTVSGNVGTNVGSVSSSTSF